MGRKKKPEYDFTLCAVSKLGHPSCARRSSARHPEMRKTLQEQAEGTGLEPATP
jgi:hypothetical protein